MVLGTNTGTVYQKGFFTTQRYLQGKTLVEIERLLGFREGRLSKGAWFFVANRLPGTNDFDLAGYSQVAGHRTHQQYGSTLNNPSSPSNADALEVQKKNAIACWSLHGRDRLIKVKPEIEHNSTLSDDFQYPPGHGIPQWKVKNLITCRAICFVNGYPDGRFKPEEGYLEIKYK